MILCAGFQICTDLTICFQLYYYKGADKNSAEGSHSKTMTINNGPSKMDIETTKQEMANQARPGYWMIVFICY